ncbi:ABC transporter substrate-binding protein [Bdellovibrio bacteriovorus]|uniref:ABC transporter substrate-binding protein n=1 Tax=Bdellovibrio bacteriovorus TaxID=959 RepID=UPI0035A5A1A9
MFRSLLFAFSFLATTAFAQTPVTIALNWKAEPEFGGFYAAALQGIYKKHGLDVKIAEGGSGTPTVQMLANNKVEFAIVSADEVILSHDRGGKNKVKALFSVYHTSPYIIMTHAERGFKSLKDVFAAGGVLSVQSGLPYFQYLTKKLGKPRGKVVPYLGGVGNFVNDKNFSQQGFITVEPLAAEKAGAKVQSFLVADEGFNPYLVVLAVTEETLKTKGDLVKKVVAASREGWQEYLKNPQATNEAMAKLNKAFDLKTFNKAAEIQKPLIESSQDGLGTMSAERWTTLVQQLKDLKLIKSAPKAQDLFINL